MGTEPWAGLWGAAGVNKIYKNPVYFNIYCMLDPIHIVRVRYWSATETPLPWSSQLYRFGSKAFSTSVLKRMATRDFWPLIFHQTSSRGSLFTTLKCFIRLRTRRDIRIWNRIGGVNGTAELKNFPDATKNCSAYPRRPLAVFFSHCWIWSGYVFK